MSTPRSLSTLLCQSLTQFRSQLTPASRLLSLDPTPTHVNLAVSDPTNTTAIPFGVLTRTPKPQADAKILSSALQHAEKEDENNGLPIHALVVNVPPLHASHVFEYIRDLVQIQGFLDDLKSVLLYSEAHVVRRIMLEQHDFTSALRVLPHKMERRRRKRFQEAMHPHMAGADGLMNRYEGSARLAASEVLQVVLDELKRDDE